MKGILVVFLAASLLVALYAAEANAGGSKPGVPPVEQPLVREGEFAVELATALNLTPSHDEAAAQRALVSIDITPRNGWISDYPMTPDILAEIRQSAAKSASSGKLRISGTEAAGIVDKVSIAMNLPLRTSGEKYTYESGSEYPLSSQAPAPETSEYVEPSAIQDYYSDNEPPVVTYYPPPWEYSYLYDWVPDPFWWGGFGFGGYFILADFDRHHHHHHITNHVANANGTVNRISPAARANAPRNFTSSGPARDADRDMRNPGSPTRDIDRYPARPDAGSRSSSSSGGALGGPPSSHFPSGGGYHGGSGGGGFGGGGFGGFHGGGGGRR